MSNTKISITVGTQSFTFVKELTIGEELRMFGRRSTLCGGQYGAMSISPEMSELQASITANRIATLELHLDKADDEFEGFVGLETKTLNKIWEEFADKAGLFRKDDGEKDSGKKEESTKENPK